MARPDEVKSVKAFRDAKTGKEMVYAWASQSPGRNMEPLYQQLKIFADEAPWIIENFCHKPLADLMDRGVLDRKTRELVLLGVMMAMREKGGTIAHVANSLAAGITREEILAVAECVCYEGGKTMSVAVADMLTAAFEACKDVKVYKP